MRYVASCLIGLCACSTSAAAGQATGLPVNHRWIFDGASFALDGAYDQNDQANAQTTAFTAGLALDVGYSAFGGVRRLRVPVSVAIPIIACSGKRFALIVWGRGGLDAERVSRTGQSATTSYLLGYGFGIDTELRNGLGFQFAYGGQTVGGQDPQIGSLGIHFSTRSIPHIRPSKAGEGCRR